MMELPSDNANALHAQLARQWTAAQPAVASYISSLVPDYHDSRDILQNVATVLVRKQAEYEPGTSFLNWALSVARFEILAYRRDKAKKNMPRLDDDAVDLITKGYQRAEEQFGPMSEALEQCLKKLTSGARRMLELRYSEDLLPAQIAPRVERSANAITVALHRIRTALRECIESRMQRGTEGSP